MVGLQKLLRLDSSPLGFLTNFFVQNLKFSKSFHMNPKPPLACLELRFYNHNFVPDSTARAQMCYGGNPHLPGFLGLRFEVFHLKALCSIKMYPYFFAKRHNFPTLFPLYLDKHSHVLISLGFNHHRNQAALKGN